MDALAIFAGWGPCGALNNAGETEFYVVWTVLELLALATSGTLLLIAHSRLAKILTANRYPKQLFIALHIIAGLIKAAVLVGVSVVLLDYILGDANLGGYDDAIPCDPIDAPIIAQAVGVGVLTLFLGYRQAKKYLRDKDRVSMPPNPTRK